METNVLYYGDNLDILRRYIPDESVDLVYLDPPFNSNRDYNVIFKDESGRKSDAQLLAFEDTWHWGPGVAETYSYLTNTSLHRGKVPESVSAIIGALRQGIGTNQMLAYVVEMTVRLVELRRILKPTGSLYLHCDPTASHYLKLVLDAVFGPDRFRNEITWRRTTAHNSAKKYAPVHDTLLYYTKTDVYTWNEPRTGYEPEYLDKYYRFDDGDGRLYWRADITGPGIRHGSSGKAWRNIDPSAIGRHWTVPYEDLEKLDAEGRLYWPKKGTMPQFKRYRDDLKGKPVTDVWDDIDRINPVGNERLGYPTQKPLALLERVLATSSNPVDIVLDPFCGCGTALVAAEKLGRKWVGIDVTHLSIAVMRSRLRDAFPSLGTVKVIGQPTEVEGARMLAQQSLDGRYEFQYWALSLVDAQPVEKKKGADSGIDGRITFTDTGGEVRPVLVSVKSGNVNVSQLRDLVGTMQREAAPLGLFVTLEEPSKPMLVEAAGAGTFHSELANRDYPKVQVLTIRELLDGRRPQLPLLVLPTFQQAEKVEQESPGQEKLFG
jgi:DNA modification methylase